MKQVEQNIASYLIRHGNGLVINSSKEELRYRQDLLCVGAHGLERQSRE